MNDEINVLFIGDIVGRLGRAATKTLLPELRKEFSPDVVIANGENSASGYGITEDVYKQLTEMGIDCLTMGNHTFDKKDFANGINNCTKLIRPANYPPEDPGQDHMIMNAKGAKVAVLTLLGRVFVHAVDCPFRVGAAMIEKIKKETPIIIVDVHAEATSEKCALGYYFDGTVSAVVGTHTHVMTADERILSKGTAYISDIGMVGALDSVIGMDKDQIISRFITQMPNRFEPVTKGPALFNAVMLKIDKTTGKAKEIRRIIRVVQDLEAAEEQKAAQSKG